MKFLLQKRHLGPSHSSTLYVPDIEKDNLVINTIPDFFVCGHIHKAAIKKIEGVEYYNDGDWVESLTALVETKNGKLKLVDWHKKSLS